jgi:hypothetical protein
MIAIASRTAAPFAMLLSASGGSTRTTGTSDSRAPVAPKAAMVAA